MDAATLRRAMNNSNVPDSYVGPFVSAMVAAGCVNQRRAAMWCAQIGHESVGLHYMEEIASGTAYNGRLDLGNTQPGDGPRFKGRGPIQLTGRHNYGVFGQWCASKALIGDPNYFVNNPVLVASPQWGFLAASWYWTVARPQLNAHSDNGDVRAATQDINGGQNGYADRLTRYNMCMALGGAIIPDASSAVSGPSAQQRLFLV